jgi:hypothetical protein
MSEGNTPNFKVPTTPTPIAGPEDVFGQYFGDSEEVQYMLNDMRQRHAAVLEMDGQFFIWMKRKQSGTVCPYWSNEAANCSDPLNSEAACYNTKFLGGYHQPMLLKIGLPTASKQNVAQDAGLLKVFPQKSWTLWTPELMDRDMLIKQKTGERFEVQNVSPTGPWRGAIICQFFDLRVMNLGADFGMKVPVEITGL